MSAIYPEDVVREVPRVLESPMTGNRYVSTKWVDEGGGNIVSLEKYEVPQTNKKLPMVFSSDPAYGHLRSEKTVLSLRSELKPEGQVWIRRSRTGKKHFEATRRLVAVLDTRERFKKLVEHEYEESGFRFSETWAEEYIDHQGEIELPAYVYRIRAYPDGEGGDAP